MKTHTAYHTFETPRHRELVNITDLVQDAVGASGVTDGLVFVSAMHITAAVIVNDDEPGLHRDLERWLQQLAPEGVDYDHHGTGEVNADAHLKNLLLGKHTLLPITGGRLDLGPWQRVFYYEFDGRRPKRLVIKVMGE